MRSRLRNNAQGEARIQAATSHRYIDFTPEEVVDMKEAVLASQTILVAGQVIKIIDPTSEK